jgi:hypothetical protein
MDNLVVTDRFYYEGLSTDGIVYMSDLTSSPVDIGAGITQWYSAGLWAE